MKKAYWLAVVVLFVTISMILTGCPRNSYNSPSSPYGNVSTSTATPTATGPTSTPTSTPTATGTGTPTNSPTVTFTRTFTFTSTNSPTVTSTFTTTNTATVTSTATTTDTPTITLTPTETFTPTQTLTSTNTATVTHTATITDTATVTSTPTAAPITITVTTGSNSNSASNFSYFVAGVTNNSDASLSLTAHVGNVITIPSNGTHPLFFYDSGTATCIFDSTTNSASGVTYTFPATGTYYFHCGNHARTCSPTNNCGSTNCTAMAAVITVN